LNHGPFTIHEKDYHDLSITWTRVNLSSNYNLTGNRYYMLKCWLSFNPSSALPGKL